MEGRRVSDISEGILYPKSTTYLRILEMILCVVCLGLAFYVWFKGNVLIGAIVILFATSFGFLAVTFTDFLASWKRRQYAAPIWAGLAFLAAFMYFLSFGFMVLQTFIGYILIGIVFAITGIVYLLDGIIIILHFFQSRIPKKVYPISREKNSLDKATQTDDYLLKPLPTEVPIEVKQIDPVMAVGEVKPTTSLPIIHSVSELGPPRRTTEERPPPPEISLVPGPTTDINRNIYPPINVVPPVPVDPSSSGPSGPGTPQPVSPSTYRNEGPPKTCCLPNQVPHSPETFVGPPNWNQAQLQGHSPYHQGAVIPSYQTGEPQPVMPIDPRYQSRPCRCCATRSSQEARDEITPFVMHHYNQTPCGCGYTHYQSSTVVRGAVKQYPRDTVEQQQKMIKDQLDQTRESNVYHSCTCHDGPFTEKKVPRLRTIHDSSKNDTVGNAVSLNSSDNALGNFTENNSNISLNSARGSILEALARKYPRQKRDSNTSRRRVTLDLTPSSSPPQKRSDPTNRPGNQANKNTSTTRPQPNEPPVEYDNVYAEDGQPENWQPSTSDNLETGRNVGNDVNVRRRLGQDLGRDTDLDFDRSTNSFDQIEDQDSGSTDSQDEITSTTGLLGKNDHETSSILCRGLPPKCHCCPNVKNNTKKSPKKYTERERGRRFSNDSNRSNYGENVPNRTFVISEPPVEEAGPFREPQNIQNEENRSPRRLGSDDGKTRRSSVQNDSTEIDNASPVVLPRSLDPIEELRSREGIQRSDSEENISHIPPYYDGFPNKGVSKQTSCDCSCICTPQKKTKEVPKEPKKSTASNTNKYENTPLTQRPYHPKDEFKLPDYPFKKAPQENEIPEDCLCEVPPRRKNIKKNPSRSVDDDDNKPSRARPEKTVLKNKPSKKSFLKCLEECPDCLSKRQKHEEECPEECSSCPIRHARLAMGARPVTDRDRQDRSSPSPQRGPLKRSYPDGMY